MRTIWRSDQLSVLPEASHLPGFDSGAKALVTTVKETVDNALDACEEAGEFRVAAEDNGPGSKHPIY